MATMPRYPSLFQINTRVWLERLSREAGKPITLADIEDTTIDGFAEKGFDWIWLLSVWQTGAAGQAVSRGHPQWRAEFEAILPDLTEDDICGSGFAITAYTVSDAVGGETALAQFREKLARRGIKLLLDFVPNHTAPDHPWVKAHPDYYVDGSEEALAGAPANYLRVDTDREPKILAYGRDPNFPGWPDTLQLTYANPELQRARIDELIAIAGKCDGVRCDMAMLLLPEIFQRTWGLTPEPFWPKAIPAVHAKYPAFTFMAEVYWDLEWELQQQGFDYCYDKRLYDRIEHDDVEGVRLHLNADLAYQQKLARFIENHDEPRVAGAFAPAKGRAAAVTMATIPGAKLFHEGQFEGRPVRVPVFLGRRPEEPLVEECQAFYKKLLAAINTAAFRDGQWALCNCSGWPDNTSFQRLGVWSWTKDDDRRLIVINLSDGAVQARVLLPWDEVRGKTWRLDDALSDASYERDGDDMNNNGLYIELEPWAGQIFAFHAVGNSSEP